MGKRGKRREIDGASSSSEHHIHTSLSIREEASGKRQSHNAKSILKLKHLHNLAEDSVGCLGAFFGRRFAEFGESLGISPDPSLFPCQRCETILHPGFNCTIRVEKNRAKRPRRSKTKTPAQNNVVYTCHFCSHRNLKRGTPKGYIREIAPSKTISSNPEPAKSAAQKCITAKEANANNIETDQGTATPLPAALSNICSSLEDSPASLLATTGRRLLDSKPRKRKKPGPKGSADEPVGGSAPGEGDKTNGTSKRRRKSWTTLKEIAESEERERNQRFTNFSIPFVL